MSVLGRNESPVGDRLSCTSHSSGVRCLHRMQGAAGRPWMEPRAKRIRWSEHLNTWEGPTVCQAQVVRKRRVTRVERKKLHDQTSRQGRIRWWMRKKEKVGIVMCLQHLSMALSRIGGDWLKIKLQGLWDSQASKTGKSLQASKASKDDARYRD